VEFSDCAVCDCYCVPLTIGTIRIRNKDTSFGYAQAGLRVTTYNGVNNKRPKGTKPNNFRDVAVFRRERLLPESRL
jgi:hypothetical protein